MCNSMAWNIIALRLYVYNIFWIAVAWHFLSFNSFSSIFHSLLALWIAPFICFNSLACTLSINKKSQNSNLFFSLFFFSLFVHSRRLIKYLVLGCFFRFRFAVRLKCHLSVLINNTFFFHLTLHFFFFFL